MHVTTTCARRTQEILQRYKELQDIIAILGLDELSEEDRVTVVAGPQDPEVPVAAVLRGRGVHRSARHLRAGRGDGRGFEALVSGELDHVPEQAFFNVGGVESVLEKAKTLQES